MIESNNLILTFMNLIITPLLFFLGSKAYCEQQQIDIEDKMHTAKEVRLIIRDCMAKQ